MKSDDVRHIEKQEPRVETGAVQFGDDWPGLFIRGDNCFMFSVSLGKMLRGEAGEMDKNVLKGLLHDLDSTRVPISAQIKDELNGGN